jgi:hypothetical protein
MAKSANLKVDWQALLVFRGAFSLNTTHCSFLISEIGVLGC